MNVIVKNGKMCSEEIEEYKKYISEKHPNLHITDLTITLDPNDPDFVNLEYKYENLPKSNIPFSRIRRITGYLVGGMERWNDAKTAEEHDRIKHNIPQY